MNGARPEIPILVYHSITARSAAAFRRYTVAPAQFREHLAYLAENGYRAITISERLALSQSLSPGNDHERCVALTFDDAFQDFIEHALPCLLEFGMTATLYIPTSYAGGTSEWLAREGESLRPIMSWAEIAAAAASGIECGAHSHTHPELDLLPSDALDAEIVRPKQLLEDQLAQQVDTFAYPFGFHDRRVRAAVARAGYRTACAVGNVTATFGSDPLALPRLTVARNTDVIRLHRLLCKPTGPGEQIVSEAKRHLWRLKRRWSR